MKPFPRLLLACLPATLLLASVSMAVEEKDECEISGFDFFVPVPNKTIVSQVAGPPSCNIGSGSNCFCGPNYDEPGIDQVRDGSASTFFCSLCWIFGAFLICTSLLIVFSLLFSGFGLATHSLVQSRGKVCPDQPPYEQGFLGETPACDTSTNPTGQLNDWSCGYSNCHEGGDESVICGCVDLASFGIGTGQKWFCIHSACECPDDPDTSAGAPVIPAVAILVISLAFVGY